MSFARIIKKGSIIPVVTFSSKEQACPLAEALASGGISTLEITLRSEFGLQAITDCRQAFPEMTIGAGSVKNAVDLQSAINAGAQFAVSPGTTQSLLDAADQRDIPFLPGVATPGEMLSLFESGYDCLKLFPAHTLGGISYLKSLGGPLPEISFCPSGGINESNFLEYLALPNVAGVSGSWMAPMSLIETGDWTQISDIAKSTTDRFKTST